MPQSLNHITLAVRDIERSFDFYQTALGFSPVAKWPRGAYLELGELWLALILDEERSSEARPDYSHIAFSVAESEFESKVEQLKSFGCREWSINKSEGSSFYFLDFDGHRLEIHVGDLESRLATMKKNPWAEFTFYR